MKKILLLALGLLMLASMSIMAQQVTLNVFYYVDATQAGYAEDQAIWQKFIDQNPDIKIVKEELFDQAFHDKIGAYIAAGTIPDVMFMWPSGRSTALHEKKLVKDLAPLLGKDLSLIHISEPTRPY